MRGRLIFLQSIKEQKKEKRKIEGLRKEKRKFEKEKEEKEKSGVFNSITNIIATKLSNYIDESCIIFLKRTTRAKLHLKKYSKIKVQ